MKSYTDIEQSKKLAEILPLESADMQYISYRRQDDTIEWIPYLGAPSIRYDIPCWSLSALLDILAKETNHIDEDGYVVLESYKGNWWNVSSINCVNGEIRESSNPVDACYELILKLHELKKL